MTEIQCPLCGNPLRELEDMAGWYACTNEHCSCSDGKFSLYKKPRPLNWIRNRQMLEDQRQKGLH